jgi:hypothetical protein
MLNIARGLLISAAFVLLCGWALQGSPSFQTCIQQDKKEAAADQPENYVSTFAARADIYRDCLGDFVHDRKDEILVAFTVILAFSTIFLWVATRDLVRSAERTARSELRAYVGISNVIIKNIVADEKPIIEIRFRNFGKTPAYKMRSWTDSVLEPTGTKEKLLKLDREWTGASVLNPDDAYTNMSTRKTAVTAQEADAILTDTKRLYVRGGIQYRDAFGKKRWVYFGFETNGRTLIERGQMAVSDGQNTAT